MRTPSNDEMAAPFPARAYSAPNGRPAVTGHRWVRGGTARTRAEIDAAIRANSTAFATHMAGILFFGVALMFFGAFILMPHLESRAQFAWEQQNLHDQDSHPEVRISRDTLDVAAHPAWIPPFGDAEANARHRAQLSRESEQSNEKDPNEPKRWRDDGRCGPKYPAPGADFGECDPNADENEKGPCCNPQSGWCGNIRGKSWGHCPPACKHCIDFGPNGNHNNAVAKRVLASTVRPRKEDPPAPVGEVHDWGMSAMNVTPPDGARIHQTIGLEDMVERLAGEDPENARRREFIKSMMRNAWAGYEKYAWGENELNPKARKGHSASVFGQTKMGATLVDALDTLMIMNMTEEVARARDWISKELHFTGSTYVSVFEVTIRFVGGLLSAYAISGDTLYRDKAYAIARKLLPAFNTPSGIPMAQVNLDTGQIKNWGWASGKASVLSEFGTMQMEFEYLSLVTGDMRFRDMINYVTTKVIQMRPENGLYPNFLNPKTGKWGSKLVSVGALGDSFYEYLLKMWVYHGGRNNLGVEVDVLGRRAFDEAMDAVQKNLLKVSSPGNYLHLVDMRNSRLITKMGHLACFAGGMFALGAKGAGPELSKTYMNNAAGITHTCHAAYVKSKVGLGPEVMHFDSQEELTTRKKNEKYYILRPETIESYFYMWRLTKDQKYRDWAWEAAQAIESHCRCGEMGYCGVTDVFDESAPQDDVQQSFFLAETLKYLYLIFCDDDVVSLDLWVLNTEAHPLPIQNYRSQLPKPTNV